MNCGEWPINQDLGPFDIDYEYAYYCTFGKFELGCSILLFLWVMYLINVLGNTASNYFSPTLASICERLNLSYDIAGVTFLAFGNGAPDVFSSISSFTGGDGVMVGLGALLGASVFVATIVVGSIAILCPCEVSSRIFLRDISFHIIAVSTVTFVAVYKSISILMAITLFVIYIVYVSIVLLASYYSTKDGGIMLAGRVLPMSTQVATKDIQTAFWHKSTTLKETKPPSSPDGKGYTFLTIGEDDTKDNDDDEVTINLSGGFMSAAFDAEIFDDYFETKQENDNYTNNIESSSIGSNNLEIDSSADESNSSGLEEGLLSKRSIDNNKSNQSASQQRSNALASLYWQQWMLRRRLRRSFLDSSWWESNWQGKVVSVLELPLTLARDLTIPTVDDNAWSKLYAVLQPMGSAVFLVFISGMGSQSVGVMPAWAVCLISSVPFCVLMYLLTHHNKPPQDFWLGSIWNLLGFVMCIAWIYALAKELVTCLTAIGAIYRISPGFLGLTVLAWGNSIGDFFSNTAVARQGFGEMAIAGCYAGPVFNLLIGLGFSFSYACMSTYPAEFPIELGTSSILSLAFLYLALTSTAIIVSMRKFKLDKSLGKYLISLYCLYTVCQFIVLFAE